MSNLITLGLSTIKLGAVATDGGAGNSLAVLGKTYQNTCKMQQDDPTVTEHFAEETEEPVVRVVQKGKVQFMFSIMDPDADVLQKVFGGTVTGTTPKTWNAPRVTPNIEQTVEITAHEGLKVVIPRGSVTAKLNVDYSRQGIFLVEVTVVPLLPKKADVAPFYAIEPEA